MTNMINEVGQKYIKFIFVIWPFAAALTIAATLLMIEDYSTTLHGYLLIPTEKVNKEWVPWVVAFIPQAGQIVLFYLYATDTTKVWASKIAFFLFLADGATDVFFKIGGEWQGVPMLITAILETIVVFTVGSEFLFTVCLAFCAETFGEFIASAGKIFDSIINGGLSLVGANTAKGKPQTQQQQRMR